MTTFALLGAAFGAGIGAGWALASRRRKPVTDRDGLTGLLRREAFEEQAGPVLTRTAVLALLDVVDFKGINDRYGHLVGDEVLRCVAGRLAAGAGVEGLAGRFGGDEFVLLTEVDGLSPSALQAVLDRLTLDLSEPVLVADVGPIPVAVSVGVVRVVDLPASLAPHGSATHAVLLKEALAHADVAMYDAKRSGSSWRLWDARVHPRRPAAEISPAPAHRYREHGPAALEGK